MLKTSVIIPVYNAEKTLGACLDALLTQSNLPDEILVVDDGSTDQTKSIAESYSLVKVLTQKNQGPAKARNEGARAAKHPIIIFLDSDCVPEKNWLAEMVKPFEDETIVGVQGAYKTKQKQWVAQFDQADIEYRYEKMKRSPKLDWIGSYSAAYRKNIFLENKGFDETFPRASGEDAELSYRLAEKGFVLVFAPSAIVFHTHPATLSHYLRVKFFRAYWRTRMYLKHPGKSVRDSYTPHLLKINFIVGGVFWATLLYLAGSALVAGIHRTFLLEELVILIYVLWLLLGLILITLADFIYRIALKQPLLVPGALVLIFLRSLVFVLGAGFGLLDRRVRA